MPKVVIDLDKEIYDDILSDVVFYMDHEEEMRTAIRSGHVLGMCETCQEWGRHAFEVPGAHYCCNLHIYTGPEFFCGDYVEASPNQLKPKDEEDED